MSNKPLTYYALVIITLAFFFSVLASHLTSKQYEAIKSGDKTLTCFIGDQYKVIDPTKIETKVGDTYVFTNGYASNCKILDVPYLTFRN